MFYVCILRSCGADSVKLLNCNKKMKIYQPAEPPYLMRINIKKQGYQTEFITLSDTTQDDVFIFIKAIIEREKISPFVKGKVTNVEIRESKGSVNGKSVSLSFKGIEPKKVYELIINQINIRNENRT